MRPLEVDATAVLSEGSPAHDADWVSGARTLARLDIALSGFDHPAGALQLPWDIQRADSARGLLVDVADDARRALVHGALDRFEHDAKPVLHALPTQPIHNDFNSYNLLVDANDTDRIAAVLDFGDMVRAPTVDDLAVAAAYQIDLRSRLGALASQHALICDVRGAGLFIGIELVTDRATRTPATARPRASSTRCAIGACC